MKLRAFSLEEKWSCGECTIYMHSEWGDVSYVLIKLTNTNAECEECKEFIKDICPIPAPTGGTCNVDVLQPL